MKFLLVFLGMAAYDFVWTELINATTAGRELRAAFTSTLLLTVGALCVIEYVKEPWLILAAGAGGFVGTYLSVRRSKRTMSVPTEVKH